jgi:hypothetical protein
MSTGDPSLTDDDLQGEIDLVGALVLEASETDGQMTQERIDEILGVADDEPDEPQDGPGGAPPPDGAPEGSVTAG